MRVEKGVRRRRRERRREERSGEERRGQHGRKEKVSEGSVQDGKEGQAGDARRKLREEITTGRSGRRRYREGKRGGPNREGGGGKEVRGLGGKWPSEGGRGRVGREINQARVTI